MSIQYKTPIRFAWIPKFRGALNRLLEQENPLFHNHLPDGSLRYSYPLIQYKKVHDCACVIGINAGAEELGAILPYSSQRIELGEHSTVLELDHVRAYHHTIQVWDSFETYTVRKYLPLNEANYTQYTRLNTDDERHRFLERMLVGNILSMAKGLGIFFERKVECRIEEIINTGVMDHKNTGFMSFDLRFNTNVSLPGYFGIGKGSSHGYGVIYANINNIQTTL